MPGTGPLHVDTTELRLHARKLEAVATELRKSQAEAHGNVASVAQGFNGTAASGAVSELLEYWERSTEAHHKDLMAASARHETDAVSFEAQEDENKRRFQSGGGQR
ncbi:Uncharacterised protein [Mycobacteroides abscessus subsp. abscessus]|uniref:hypothetical protein n=1 Tax=Mycobacteroides abscessus TaxID=36809 RepID=UPI00092AEEBB|nr:hypothetical protein [Mycobacteroides abscessus]SHU93184.1 Uncharacterised protein [Mycobacteroides abscessus subsp. abscessus]SHX72820.1 Uncharacterised protein [Mycobacteroides abscessus subsp. abscessus]SIG87107.1 Uncharacterised protein [Mycobacteroides abscessus subsp. abscessus]SKD18827.1 Uncharacterised protein [Mycobacteroides abscessus subsp. abscessus]SKN10335.1 Uncharacterised protein [Mycobacteroides abscessus subsp. abscessus]